MQYIPKKYQELALDFLHTHDRGALFLDMGLGKTVVTLTYLNELKQEGKLKKALVIAPLRVAQDTWSREHEKWDHLKDLKLSKVLGSAKERDAALKEDADIYVINRENVVWLIEHLKYEWPFNATIIDELSSFKSPQAKRWRYLKKVIKGSEYVVGLTGTPAPNGYMDLWPEIFLLDSGEALGRTLTSYRDLYFLPGRRNGHVIYEWLIRRGARERIDAKLKPLCLSMSKEDWLDLPPITYNNIYVKMSDEERRIYDQFEKERVLPLLKGEVSNADNMDSAIVGASAAVLSGKLLQMANGAVYTSDEDGEVFHIHDRKLDALEDILEFSGGVPVLCFYGYKHDLSRICEKFPEARILKTPQDIEDWNNGKIPLLLAHPASASMGLNLQQGSGTVVFFSLPWSWEQYTQSVARVYRQGQERPVVVHHILCENTLDDRVINALHKKEKVERGLLEALKDYVTERTAN